MDAVEFLKTRARLCRTYEDCEDCPIEFFCSKGYDTQDEGNYIVNVVNDVEQWAKEHPVKTRQSEFLKMWPEVELGDDDLPGVAPCQLYKDKAECWADNRSYCKSRNCGKCRRDFWLKEID